MQELLRSILQNSFRSKLPGDAPGESVGFLIGLISNGLVLLFVGVIIVAIFFAILAGIKFVTSQGEGEKVQEARDALRSVFIGVLSTFVGVLFVLIISGVFVESGSDELRGWLCAGLEPEVKKEDCIQGSK